MPHKVRPQTIGGSIEPEDTVISAPNFAQLTNPAALFSTIVRIATFRISFDFRGANDKGRSFEAKPEGEGGFRAIYIYICVYYTKKKRKKKKKKRRRRRREQGPRRDYKGGKGGRGRRGVSWPPRVSNKHLPDLEAET